MDWFYFHLATSILAFVVVCGTPRRPGRFQHIAGAVTLVISNVLSQYARYFTGAADPVFGYLAIDILAISAFGVLMFSKKAVWAAFAVLFHFFMICAHAIYYTGETLTQSAYLWSIGILSFLSFLSVLFGGLTGLYQWGEYVDRKLSPGPRSWTWSGVSYPRGPYHNRLVG